MSTARAATRWLAALALAVSLAGAPVTALAGSDEPSATSRFFWGIGSGICTLVYTPVKVVYAASAIPLGVLVYLWSVGDAEMTGRVIGRATAGDYVVTPDHLRGKRRLVFIGRRGEQREEEE